MFVWPEEVINCEYIFSFSFYKELYEVYSDDQDKDRELKVILVKET